jgi:hypothetical protein
MSRSFQTLRRSGGRHRFQGPVGAGKRPAKIFEENQCYLAGKLLHGFQLFEDAEGLGGCDNLFRSEDWQLQRAFRGPLQGQHHLAAASAVGGNSGGVPSQDVARRDQVGVGAAYPARALGSNAAGNDVAVLAAGTGHAEPSVGLLGVKPVKGSFDANLLHMREHLANRGVGSAGDYIGLAGEFLSGRHRVPFFITSSNLV